MSLASKIKMSFVIIIVFPVAIILMFMLALGKHKISEIENSYDINIEDAREVFDSTSLLDSITESTREKIASKINEPNFEPTDKEILERLNKDSKQGLAKIIVYYNDTFVYSGLDEDKSNTIIEMLPRYDSVSDVSVMTYYVGDKTKYLVKPIPFTYQNGEFGTIYIVAETGHSIQEVRTMVIQFIISCVVLITLTGACLTLWLYKSVLSPINKLIDAARNITQENLEFSMSYPIEEEFIQLYDTFEEMRVHLKESIEKNINNDIESKELISNISHDLKTPITAIKGYVEGIMDGVADTPEKIDRYIKTIYNKANDMDRLIGELTDYSKIDTNKIPYHFIKLNVAEYFDDCIEEISTELENKNFKLAYLNYTDKSTEVIADPEQIKRVINNIISNSLKYNDKENGIINIRIKDQKDYVHFEIEDNGKGVSPDDLPYIFERFYRTDSSRNSKKGGSGIGLSIVKKIIEAHGGTIWAFSTLETGAAIHFLLKKVGINTTMEEIKRPAISNEKIDKKILKYADRKGFIGGRDNGK